jgi:hypothetical protein
LVLDSESKSRRIIEDLIRYGLSEIEEQNISVK